MENAVQILGQNSICIAFSKLTVSPISTANRLKAQSANIIWTELKRELSTEYSIIPSESHATQAFT